MAVARQQKDKPHAWHSEACDSYGDTLFMIHCSLPKDQENKVARLPWSSYF